MNVSRSLRIAVQFLTIALLPLLGSAAQGAGSSQDEHELHFDFPGMRIGVAESDKGPTGTTVFYFPKGVMVAADVRGGSPGTLNVPFVEQGYESKVVDAVVLSGGSAYGLSAATGVTNEIKRLKREKGEDSVAVVLGAIIFDLGNRRFSRVTPDDALGAAALDAAKPDVFPLGAHGAGRSAMQGRYFGCDTDNCAKWPHSGQGGAFRKIGPTKIAVFTVINALGAIVDRNGRLVRCRRNAANAVCPLIADLLRSRTAQGKEQTPSKGGMSHNTTISLVVTNQKMSFADLQRLAVQVHTSMARAIVPYSTRGDGDVLFAASTGEVVNPDLSPLDLGVVASEVAWDAILHSVPDVPAMPSLAHQVPAASDLRRYTGSYRFADGSVLTVRSGNQGLSASFTKGLVRGNIFFDENTDYALKPTSNGQFIVDTPAHDVVRFDGINTHISGLTLNPGPWAQSAQRE